MDMKKREAIKDYILLMLGAPVIKIELDPKMLDLCIDVGESDTQAYFDEGDISESQYVDLVQHRAYMTGLGILAKIRGKYNPAPGGIKLDSKQLREEVKDQNDEWHYKVEALSNKYRLNHDGDPDELWKDA